MLVVAAVRAHRRFAELRSSGGMGITEAENQMLTEPEWKHLNCRQAIRRRRDKGEAVEPAFAFKEKCVELIGPFGWFVRPPDLSYKTSPKKPDI